MPREAWTGQPERTTNPEVLADADAVLGLAPEHSYMGPLSVVVVAVVLVIITFAPLGLNGGTVRESGQVREEAALSVSPRVFFARRGLFVCNAARFERSA